MFDGLKEHAGWRRLLDKVREGKESFFLSMARRLMRGDYVVDQREIDYLRGYFDGALDTLEMPERADENLEAAARRAFNQAKLIEVYTELEGDSPYA